MKVALLVFVSMFFTKASAVGHDNEFTECLDLESFKYIKGDLEPWGKDGQIIGQCIPSETPGAFYTHVGDEAKGKKAKWECLGIKSSLPDEEQTKHKIEEGFAGFCKFGGFLSQRKKEDIELCEDNPFHCRSGPKQYWGACVAQDVLNWECISQEDEGDIANYVKGDCRALPVQKRDGQELYKGVCQFATEMNAGYPWKVKCPTDLLKDEDLIIKGDPTGCNSVCFIIKEGAEGVAHPLSAHYMTEESLESKPCEWTHAAGMSELFDGECLLETHKDYEKALDWSTVKPKPKPQPAPASTLPVEPARGIGAGWIIFLVFLMLGAGGGGFLFWQRTKQRQTRPLSGGLMR